MDTTLRQEYDDDKKAANEDEVEHTVPQEDEKPNDDSADDSNAEAGRLVKEEEKADGHVSWASCEFPSPSFSSMAWAMVGLNVLQGRCS
jgi:hypothetical protein